jgi:hypothetical protein
LKIEVHLRNGRTAFRFRHRSHLTRVLGNQPDHTGGRVVGEVKQNAASSEEDWRPTSIRFISPNSVSHVLEVPASEQVTGSADPAP